MGREQLATNKPMPWWTDADERVRLSEMHAEILTEPACPCLDDSMLARFLVAEGGSRAFRADDTARGSAHM